MAYLGPIAPSMINPNVERKSPLPNSHGLSKRISMEKAAIAKHRKVNSSAFSLPLKLSSLSAIAAAITPRINGVI
ncbi:hypothetical protein VSA01S_18930 [Vibrio sagamiensis NBRC 104589]|uniref:Uncharacterized protein n=1 Tax=Vibrio sagamiensis NBRC 104589 TaxID=1219064 RepID=A0A511QEQ2_9VIBR|nr:hypothetical protein VSA01S_18930 [Vibrio sagamiensis NBRC 104589]